MPDPAHASPRVLAFGACTPLGFSAEASFAAMRAGLVAFTQGPTFGSSGEPIKVSALLGGDSAPGQGGRLEALALGAFADLDPVASLAQAGRVGLFLGLPDARECPEEVASDLLQALSRAVEFAASVRLATVRRHGRGRSAFFFALRDAMAALDAGDCDSAIVGAVDSLCSPVVMKRLDGERRLLGAVSSDGVIPGEAAAFAVLVAAHRRDSIGQQPLLLCTAVEREANHFGQTQANTARAMSAALREVRTHRSVAQSRADLLFTCETGERFWIDELSMAYFRNVALMPEPFVRTTAAEAFGDLGAASGAVQFAMGLHALARPKLDGTLNKLLLLCGASDDGCLGACMVQRAALATDTVTEGWR